MKFCGFAGPMSTSDIARQGQPQKSSFVFVFATKGNNKIFSLTANFCIFCGAKEPRLGIATAIPKTHIATHTTIYNPNGSYRVACHARNAILHLAAVTTAEA